MKSWIIYSSVIAQTFGFYIGQELVSVPGAARLVTLTDGSFLELIYNAETKNLNFNVHIKNGSFIGLGFGEFMTDTEIVHWSANQLESGASTWYGIGNDKPLVYPEV